MSYILEDEGPHYPLANLSFSTTPYTSDFEASRSQDVIKDDNQVLTAEPNGETVQPEPQYSSGFALWVNMISLMLSIFLIALDMVGFVLSLAFLFAFFINFL